MKIYSLSIQNEGYVHCKSDFYSAHDVLFGHSRYTFTPGINKLIGEIDSGNWAISYLLSMYKHRPEDFVLFEKPQVIVNNRLLSLNDIADSSLYMDRLNSLFSTNDSIKDMVISGLRYSQIDCSHSYIKDLFQIDSMRFERPIIAAGNEIFKAMAAIGFSYKKEIFCFPWLSNRRFESFHENLATLLKTLESLKKTVIIPVGKF